MGGLDAYWKVIMEEHERGAAWDDISKLNAVAAKEWLSKEVP